jgi:hypothetical protein
MSQNKPDLRLAALRRFAIAITILNLLGHTVLGFEQSWAYPLVALATTYTLEILLEIADARSTRRPVRFSGGLGNMVDFLLSAHITGMAVNMLLYANARLLPIVFAASVAICSKYIFRVTTSKGARHVFNPSNFGITLTLLLFSWVSIAPPYQFTENLSGLGDWILPAIILVSGSFLNKRLTGKFPLILGWLGGFVGQALLRALIFGTPVVAGLLPMTGLAFILFTFYMVTDPGTTPSEPRAQVLFGAAVAALYGLLMLAHVVFGLFFALTIVCALRGTRLYLEARAAQRMRSDVAMQRSVVAGRTEP